MPSPPRKALRKKSATIDSPPEPSAGQTFTPDRGSWRVITRTSIYAFHLSANPRTVDQQLGGGVISTRLLATIIECTIGAQGAWTVHPDEQAKILHYAKPELQVSDTILRIEPVT
jgi:hypothetical protein